MHWQEDALSAGAVQYSLQKQTGLRSWTPVCSRTVSNCRGTACYRQKETGPPGVLQTERNRTVEVLRTTDRMDQDCPARDCRGTVLQTEGNKTAQRAVQSTQWSSTTDTRKQDPGTEWALRTPGQAATWRPQAPSNKITLPLITLPGNRATRSVARTATNHNSRELSNTVTRTRTLGPTCVQTRPLLGWA